MPDIVGRLRTPRLASAPATPAVGEMYYNTTTNILYFWNGTAWTAASGGGAMDLRYNGAWAPGSYTDGDIVIYNGVEYMAVRTTTQTPVPWTTGTVQSVPTPVVNGQWLKGAGGIPVWTALTQADVELTPYGTSLPASPFNGQEAILVDSTTNPTYQWRFRYNSGSSSAYKWEFIGGTPFQIAPPTYANPTATAYNTDAAAGSTLTFPRAGEFLLESLAGAIAATGAIYMGFSYDPNTRQGSNLVAGTEDTLVLSLGNTCTAAQGIQNVFYTGSTGVSFVRRLIRATPVRVS